ncbi:proteoglycan 4 isoform X2 [Nilaparvata lugens]|uniref:proteoglycan 4 isoform X2 n=1 Tax=Nilaparvata lugens TaxID=108931 RepID=UPI00193EB94B|nr:proteoglycan 4 isoform X2 [Nilaparvata lugens]
MNIQRLKCLKASVQDGTLLMKDWKIIPNTLQKRTTHTTSARKYADSIKFENYNLQGFRSSMKTYSLMSNELIPTTVHRRQVLAIQKSILLARHYSKLVPKVEKWRAKSKKERRQLAKLVDCVPGKNSCGGGGFFSRIFGNLFGWKGSAELKCKNCRNQLAASNKLKESKQKQEIEKIEDDCDVDTKPNQKEALQKKSSKAKDDCDVKSDEKVKPRNAGKAEEKCSPNSILERAKERMRSSKTMTRTESSPPVSHQPSLNRKKASSSFNSAAPSDRLKQLDSLEKCIGTLQQLIKNLRLEEEVKRAAKKDTCKPVSCSKPKPVDCTQPKKPVCPEPEKPPCPVPIKPVCPETSKKPICPEPKKPCPEPSSPSCPETKKPVCPRPKMPPCPETTKPTCPPTDEKPTCPENKNPICSEGSNQDSGREPYKCGIIEDNCPPKRKYEKQQLRDKNDKHSMCARSSCGKQTPKDREESQKVKDCTTTEDESKNNNC